MSLKQCYIFRRKGTICHEKVGILSKKKIHNILRKKLKYFEEKSCDMSNKKLKYFKKEGLIFGEKKKLQYFEDKNIQYADF